MEMHKIVAIIANSALYLLFLSLISPFRFVLMLFFSPSHKSTFKKVEEWGCVISRVAKKKREWKSWVFFHFSVSPQQSDWLEQYNHQSGVHWANTDTSFMHNAPPNTHTRPWVISAQGGKKDVSKYIWALMVMITVAIANPNNWCLIRNVDSVFLCMDLCRIEQQSRETGVEICHSFVSPLPGEKHLHTCFTHAFMSFFIYHYLLREERCQNILGF